jgi:hypothetical protein
MEAKSLGPERVNIRELRANLKALLDGGRPVVVCSQREIRGIVIPMFRLNVRNPAHRRHVIAQARVQFKASIALIEELTDG